MGEKYKTMRILVKDKERSDTSGISKAIDNSGTHLSWPELIEALPKLPWCDVAALLNGFVSSKFFVAFGE